jgi:hypothetical protein
LSIPDKHNRNQFAANIPKYFVYTVLKGFSFGLIAAMWVIFLTQHRGLSGDYGEQCLERLLITTVEEKHV